jgi:hypothetical protein
MTLNELFEEIDVALLDREPHIREGQFVFNYINRKYGNVAREVMDIDGVDCFYRDRDIDEFLKCVHKRLSSNGN